MPSRRRPRKSSRGFDFKGTSASISELNRKDKELTLTADVEAQLESVKKVLVEKMIKRGVDPKCLDYQKLEQATHKTVRQKVKLKDGIDKDTAKSIQKTIKELKLKVNASIQGEALRVSGSKRDDLQAVIAHLKAHPPEIPAAVYELPIKADWQHRAGSEVIRRAGWIHEEDANIER